MLVILEHVTIHNKTIACGSLKKIFQYFSCSCYGTNHVVDPSGTPINYPNKNTPLHVALEKGRKEIANRLIDEGADINVRNKDGKTPLHAALYRGCEEIANRLIDLGTNINDPDNNGYTPLHAALYGGFKEIANSLIDEGADINVRNKDGRTSLHMALYGGCEQIANRLIDLGANINDPEINGNTPLHMALYGGCKEIANRLIDEGADINASNEDGDTPLQIAIENNDSSIANTIKIIDHFDKKPNEEITDENVRQLYRTNQKKYDDIMNSRQAAIILRKCLNNESLLENEEQRLENLKDDFKKIIITRMTPKYLGKLPLTGDSKNLEVSNKIESVINKVAQGGFLTIDDGLALRVVNKNLNEWAKCVINITNSLPNLILPQNLYREDTNWPPLDHFINAYKNRNKPKKEALK